MTATAVVVPFNSSTEESLLLKEGLFRQEFDELSKKMSQYFVISGRDIMNFPYGYSVVLETICFPFSLVSGRESSQFEVILDESTALLPH
jgi:hypothetical protein